MRRAVPLFVALALVALVIWRTDGFSPSQIAVPLLQTPDAPLSNSIQIPTTFRYLGRGRQAFAFENDDLVIKFFNKSDLSMPWKARLFSSPKDQNRWREKLRIYPESYPLAAHLLSQETGVLIAHLGQNDHRYPVIQLIDKANRSFSIDLNQVPFVLQKKGSGSFYKSLRKAVQNGTLDVLVDPFLAFHQKRISLCIADYDRDIKRNYCWDGTTLQYIDPARCFFEPNLKNPARFRLEWWKATHRLRKWISRQAPDQLASFDSKLEKIKLEGPGHLRSELR
jgi:hypothetical protein